MKITKAKLQQLIKEELQNLKKESSDEPPLDDMTHGEYFARYGSPISDLEPAGQLEAELDELSVAIRLAREEGGVADEDIRAFVEQVLKTKKVQKQLTYDKDI